MTFDTWLEAFGRSVKARQMWQADAGQIARQWFPPPASARPFAVPAVIARVPNSVFALGAMAAPEPGESTQ